MLIQEWGNATWYLFHTLSYKLKDSESAHAAELLSLFVGICKNLPCPICREDATKMLSGSKTRLVSTKADLIRFMWQFHNLVNNKLSKPEMTFEEHTEKYAQANTTKIVNFYIYVMSKNANNATAMSDSFRRQDNTKGFKKYFNENSYRFNP